jgi:hypothetical protein
VEEAFLDARGSFAQTVSLQPEADNALELVLCDVAGKEVARVPICVRHRAAGRPLGQAVLPTQIITRPLQIEVLDRARRRVKQVVAPIGATLPGTFTSTCHTTDQAGRILLPIYEENRVIKQMIIDNLDPRLPIGTPVDVEFAIDVKHDIEVRVRVRGASGTAMRTETATITPPPPPARPTRADVERAQADVEALLSGFSGAYRTRVKSRLTQLVQELHEALRYDDEPKAIQRMAELRELLLELQARQGQVLDPPWPRFAELVRHCLDIAGRVADLTRRSRAELEEHIRAQERYAEQAFEENNQTLYRECCDNLVRYAGYLDQVLRDALPHEEPEPHLPPEELALRGLEQFRGYLAEVWKKVRAAKRSDLDVHLAEVARRGQGLSQRVREAPSSGLREVRRLLAEIGRVDDLLAGRPASAAADEAGMLEGMG